MRVLYVTFIILLFNNPAYAVCANPAGDHGDMLYNLDHTVMQYCNGTHWVSMDASRAGGSDNLGNHTAAKDLDMTGHKIVNAAIPTSSADVTNKAYVDAAVASAASSGQQSAAPTTCYYTLGGACESGYVQMDGNYYPSGHPNTVTSTAHTICCTSPSEVNGVGTDSNGMRLGGYFVITGQTYKGNLLGGLTGANAKCLTELQEHPWKGKGSAGTLSASRVKAFLCDSATCNNLKPYTRYNYAAARNPFNGKGSLFTNMDGEGPNDSTNLGTVFGINTYWWSNRATSDNNSSLWGTAPRGSVSCNNWSAPATGETGNAGNTDAANSARWHSTASFCTNTYPLICFVDPE